MNPLKSKSCVTSAMLALICCAAGPWATRSSGATFEPDLGETLDWLIQNSGVDAEVPADAPERIKYPVPAEPIKDLLDEIPGRPLHVLDPPPRSAAWWKYPIYGVVGFPRDVLDGAFGLASFVPIINIPIVGGAYELVPTQVLLRDPRDWHRWPGRRNRNGHGWIDSDGWGWFPTKNSMSFTYADEKKLERFKAENEQISAELQRINAETEARNRAIGERQRSTRAATIEAIDAGDGREAVSRALPYHLAYPNDETAHALLLNGLGLYGDSGPAWVRPYLWSKMIAADLRVLRQAETLIARSNQDFPKSDTIIEALVFSRSRLQKDEEALLAAQGAFRTDPKNQRRARLYFETAMSLRDAESATESFTALSEMMPPDSINPLRVRRALLEGRAREVRPTIAALALTAPNNPYYQYYLGVADLALLETSDRPVDQVESALEALERSSLAAGTPSLQERAGQALRYARGLSAKESRRPSRERPRGPSINIAPSGN